MESDRNFDKLLDFIDADDGVKIEKFREALKKAKTGGAGTSSSSSTGQERGRSTKDSSSKQASERERSKSKSRARSKSRSRREPPSSTLATSSTASHASTSSADQGVRKSTITRRQSLGHRPSFHSVDHDGSNHSRKRTLVRSSSGKPLVQTERSSRSERPELVRTASGNTMPSIARSNSMRELDHLKEKESQQSRSINEKSYTRINCGWKNWINKMIFMRNAFRNWKVGRRSSG
ncbi:hypothetical protein ACA910_019096 [Epithemia clementina (nom. ined.)]